MTTHPFLSDPWMDAARELKARGSATPPTRRVSP